MQHLIATTTILFAAVALLGTAAPLADAGIGTWTVGTSDPVLSVPMPVFIPACPRIYEECHHCNE